MDTEKTVNGAGESSPAPDCSACAQLRQNLADMEWDRDSIQRGLDRWIEDCRKARVAVVEMMARGAMADDADMLERWDEVQRIEFPRQNHA